MRYYTLFRSYFLPASLVLLGSRVLPISTALAWEFPQPPAFHTEQIPLHSGPHSDVDIISGSQFSGLKTYANLPYLNCLSDEEANDKPYDIAVLGAPFDTGVTARPGARYGPTGIRTGSQRIAASASWSVYTGKNPLKSWAVVTDCGNVPLTWLDNNYALKQLDKAHRVVSGRRSANVSHSVTPRILTLGGDHTTTLSALRSVKERWGQVAVVHFDSHIGQEATSADILMRNHADPRISQGVESRTTRKLFVLLEAHPHPMLTSLLSGLNHGTFLHIAHEETFKGLITNTSVHAGIRAPLARRKGDMRNDLRCGFHAITARDLDLVGASGIISRIKERVGDAKIYISVDIDVLDPAFAPGKSPFSGPVSLTPGLAGF
ncbi:hypothetical protein TruAng_008404 [Truncatella angustata]|nr:hypothetical protein TruAng_008404 [Truncatella angustata]